MINYNLREHKLKISPNNFADICFRNKCFEIVKDDKDYRIGDKLVIEEWNKGQYTGSTFSPNRPIQYILRDCEGLQEGYCILGW